MSFLISLICLWIKRRKTLMDHISIIIIVSGYIRSRKRSTANTDKSELVPIFMWDKPIWFSLNDSPP